MATFRHSDSRKAIWQLLNTLVPYCGLWYLMVFSIQLGSSYLVTLLLALPAAAFLVRIFILFHDCVHGSFFSSKGANTFFGYLLGLLVFTPFEDWRFSHLRHHVTYANLDARGFGDVWTMTLKEYQNSPKRTRLLYKLYRNPVVLFGLGAIFLFPMRNRLPTRRVKRKEHMSVVFTNLLIFIVIWVADKVIGWKTYLLIQVPVLLFSGTAGIWLFYVQHQFEGGYWATKSDWVPLRAAMEGSSFYRLPALFQWFSGNIGFHHVHHLSPRIPNYLLKKCFESIPALQAKPPLTFLKSLPCARLKLWDEGRKEMMGFP
ncbi:fatty acid desaturase [Syntrophotalea acetylenivorans]|uniref:Fatty acid desaturase n=1 Tax=Syntrophotalea acetylenivorans TaxID=1842532 RepID=A0A1L3GT41_9BACT|nr:fatty acid desaturase [Syntrophotalea acetylenivorans]